MKRVDGRGRLLEGETLRSVAAGEGEVPLDGLDLVLVHRESLREKSVELVAAPLEHASELAHPAVRDGKRRAVVADRDGDDGRLVAIGGRRDGAEQGERLEVDPRERQAGAAASLDVALDELTVRDDEQNAPQRLASVGLPFAENAVVEHRLVERDRQRLLRAEANGVEELILVVDRGQLDAPDADSAAGDAEPDAPAREVVLLEERAQRIRERVRVAKLAVGDDPMRERGACELLERGAAVVRNARRGDLRAADLQPDDAFDLPVSPRLRCRRQRDLGQGDARKRREPPARAVDGRLGLGALRLGLTPQPDLLLQKGRAAAHDEATLS